MSGATQASETASKTCFNCGTALTGPFCPNCGQKSVPLNPRLFDVLHEFFHELLHIDGKLFSSIRQLLLAPGFLTREQFDGRRARWVPPVRLYLVFSVLYFALSALAPSSSLNIGYRGDTYEEEVAALRVIGYQNQDELRDAVNHARAKWMPRVMFVMVPVFAALVGALFRKSGHKYPEHVYFALHVHAAWFAFAACAAAASFVLPSFIAGVIQFLLVVYSVIYVVFAVATAYGAPKRRALIGSIVVLPVYAIIVLIGTLTVVVPVVLGRSGIASALPWNH
jgi:hypothetical protein